jgi:uncharacterized protein (DUF849 family)
MATNGELVAKAAELTRNVGREPATPEEAADIMEIDADHF